MKITRRFIIKLFVSFQILRIFDSFFEIKHIFLIKKQDNLHWIIDKTDL